MRQRTRVKWAGWIAVLGSAAAVVLGQEEPAAPAPTSAFAAPAWKPGAGQLVREGSFLRNRRGRLVRGEGSWMYVFDADAEGNAEPPMVMLPCRRLREMQQSMELQARTVTFQTTGQVFAYEGRNYLLPTYFGVAAAERAEPEATEVSAAPAPAANSRDPRSADLLREMSTGRKPTSTTPSRKGIAESGTESSTALREGITIVSRRGRVVRDGGELRFATDNGAEQQPERPEPALVLMPCTNLESLERMANRRGEKALVLMSGRVFAYEGRNYLMPTFFVEELDREGNLVPSP